MWLKACSLGFFCLLNIFACSSGAISPKWKTVTESTHSHVIPFLSVFFLNSNDGIAITPVSLERTDTGGKTWTTLISGDGEKSFNDLVFTTLTTGFVVGIQKTNNGYAPMILRSEDGGKNWRASDINIPPSSTNVRPLLQSVSFCNQQIGWAAGSDLIVHTTDAGRTWETQRMGNGDGLFGVACLSSERAVTIGENGLILLTKDGGKSWERQTSGTEDHLLRVRFFGKEGWILGGIAGHGVLLRSHDDGATWQSQPLEIRQPLFDIHVSQNRGWIVGADGTILETNDGGQTWALQESPTRNDLACLFFLSPLEGWAAGDKRTLLRLSRD